MKLTKCLIVLLIISVILALTSLVSNGAAKKEKIDYSKMLGAKISKSKKSNLPVKDLRKLEKSIKLPTNIDYSSEMPAVGDQGHQSSCVGWGVGEYLKGYEEMKEHNWSNTPYSAAFLYNQINGGVDNGAYIDDALLLMINDGCCKESTMPYDQNDYLTQPNTAQSNEAALYKAEEAWYLETSVENCKLQLQEEPFIIGMQVDDDFFDLDENNPIYDVYNYSYGGHCLCVIGYDDTKQAFKVINSWDTDWGINGYGWVSYSIWNNVVGTYSAFSVDDIIDDPVTPTPTIEPTETNSPTPTPTQPPIYKNKITFNGAKTVLKSGPYGAGHQWDFQLKNETKTTMIKHFTATGYPIWNSIDESLISAWDGCYIRIKEIDVPDNTSDISTLKINQLELGKNIVYLTVYEDATRWTKWKVAITREKVQVN